MGGRANKPQLCKCGCGQMTKGWYNYRTHKFCEYVKTHDASSKRKKGWSRDYPACINCGTTKTRYGSHGLCQNCEYHLLRKHNPKRRAQRHEYFHRYYMEKKRHTNYYHDYRRSKSFKAHEILRRQRRLNDPDYNLFLENRTQLIIIENRPCENCGSLDRREVDHIKLHSEGGTSELSNLRVLCFKCHRAAETGRHSQR